MKILTASLLFLSFSLPSALAATVTVWKAMANTVPMTSLAVTKQNELYAITPEGMLVYQTPGNPNWNAALRVKVNYVEVFKDGTIVALDAANKKIYSKAGGIWTSVDGFAEQLIRTMNGTRFARFQDGTVAQTGAGPFFKNKFRYIGLPTQVDDSLMMVGMDNKIYGYTVGSLYQPLPYKWIVPARSFVGTGTGTRGSMFVLGAEPDALVYFFEVNPNGWTPITGGPGMKFITMSPSGVLFGIDLNNKLHWLQAQF